MFHRQSSFIYFLILIIGIFCGRASAAEYMQLPGVIHVHSTFSSGRHSMDELVSMAEEKGLEVLILTDHDLVVMEYGIFPFRNLIKKREERPSVLKAGPQNYLAAIERLNRQQPSASRYTMLSSPAASIFWSNGMPSTCSALIRFFARKPGTGRSGYSIKLR